MKFSMQGGAVVVALAALIPSQPPGGVRAQTMIGTANAAPNHLVVPRSLKDPAAVQYCWRLERKWAHPGGPGEWRQVSNCESCNSISGQGTPSGPAIREAEVRASPVIRGGDRLTIEENSELIEGRLQAIALESAVRGEIFAARLRTTGHVIRAVAVAPGRAEFADGTSARP